MASIDQFLIDATERMEKSVQATHDHFNSVRTGRASAALLDRISIDYYGTPTPLRNIATINVPEARLLTIQPFDPSVLKQIERSIMESDLGLQPSTDGKVIRLPIPQLTEERRKEFIKVAKHKAEDARVAVRNVRRHSRQELERLAKDGLEVPPFLKRTAGRPIYRVEANKVQVLGQRIVGEKHLSLKLKLHQQTLDGIWFNHTDSLPAQAELAYRLVLDQLQGQRIRSYKFSVPSILTIMFLLVSNLTLFNCSSEIILQLVTKVNSQFLSIAKSKILAPFASTKNSPFTKSSTQSIGKLLIIESRFRILFLGI